MIPTFSILLLVRTLSTLVELVLHVWRSSSSAPHFYSVRILDPPNVRRCHIAASALNVTFARTIAWCLSTMSWAVNTCLGIASDIESTSLLCWPSGAGARYRRRMSSQVCSLYRCESGWSKQARAGHSYHSYHLNYLFILPLWSMACRH